MESTCTEHSLISCSNWKSLQQTGHTTSIKDVLGNFDASLWLMGVFECVQCIRK